jgi:hypothetical protein
LNSPLPFGFRCRGNHQIVPLFRARTALGSAVAALIDNGASQPQKIRPGQAQPVLSLEAMSRDLDIVGLVGQVLVAAINKDMIHKILH